MWGLAIPSPPQPNDMQHFLVRREHESRYGRTRAHLPPEYALHQSCRTAQLGVLVSNLPALESTAQAAWLTGRCKVKKCPNQPPYPQQPTASILPAQDVSGDVKFPRVLETWVVLYPGSPPKLASPSQLPEMPVAWFQICFRCGQDGPRTVPCPPQLCFFFFRVPAYRFCDSEDFTCYRRIYWLAVHAWPVCFHKVQCPKSLLVVEFTGLDATTRGRHEYAGTALELSPIRLLSTCFALCS